MRLFEVTLRGLREEAGADAASAAVVQRADDAYEAQHPVSGDPTRLRAALDRLGASLGEKPAADGGRPPHAWRTTIADVAADLDVIDLAVLVRVLGAVGPRRLDRRGGRSFVSLTN